MRCKDCSEVRGYPYKPVIWWRYDALRFLRAIRRRIGGRESDELELMAGWM
jgi:hypothetical protein